jgi:hypothetical protein
MRSVRAGFQPRPASTDLSVTRAAPFALAVLALLLPVRSFQQAIFAGGLALALVTFWLWGRLLGHAALGTALSPWTAIYLGQFTLLAILSPFLAANGLVAAASGHSLPLFAIVGPATVALAVLRRGDPRPAPRVDLLALLGLASVALVVSIYSAHLSALGLDVHEHLAWVQQILAGGSVPLAEPGTGIVGDYPRGFHQLSALWAAAAFAPAAGPFVKAMPFLQAALPALALAEQMVEARASNPGTARWRWELALGVAFYAYVFLLVPLVYPGPDLLGTPRYSSGGLLLMPVALVVIARVREAPRAAWAAIAALPLLAAWAILWNPIVPVLLAAVTLPVLAAFWIALRPARLRDAFSGRRPLALVACAALGALALIQDPWVMSTAADRVPAASSLLARTGLVTFRQAVARGLATPREKPVHDAPAAPPCRDLRCVSAAAAHAGADALRVPLDSLRAAAQDLEKVALSPTLGALRDAFLPALLYRPPLIAEYAALPFAAWVGAAALVAAWRARRERERASLPAGRMLAASLAGLLIGAIALAFAAGLAAALNDGRHESIILAGYLAGAGRVVSGAFFWLPFSAATVALAAPLLDRPGEPRPAPRPRLRLVLVAAGLLTWIALPLAARLNLHRPLQHRGFYGPVGLADLRAFREIEQVIPAGDGVIIPAEHANIADWEHWVLPVGETTALLPYGARRYLFNVYLGASYPLSWRDLEDRLCSSDPAARQEFLARTGARWALVRDTRAADAAAVLREPRICGRSLEAFGAVLPPAREERGIYLFRLDR